MALSNTRQSALFGGNPRPGRLDPHLATSTASWWIADLGRGSAQARPRGPQGSRPSSWRSTMRGLWLTTSAAQMGSTCHQRLGDGDHVNARRRKNYLWPMNFDRRERPPMRSGSVGAEAVSVRYADGRVPTGLCMVPASDPDVVVSETSISGNVDSAESSQTSIAQTIPDGRWIVVCDRDRLSPTPPASSIPSEALMAVERVRESHIERRLPECTRRECLQEPITGWSIRRPRIC